MGGNPDRLHFIDGVRLGADGKKTRPFDPSKDMDDLLAAGRVLPDLKAVMIDPIVLAVAKDSHKNAETRHGLQPLVNLASDCEAAVLGITHCTKGTEGQNILERITGSLAFTAVPRVVLAAASTNDDGSTGRLARVASNIGPKGGGFEYVLSQEQVPGHGFTAQKGFLGRGPGGFRAEASCR
jgi:putative DNA primase/helicase